MPFWATIPKTRTPLPYALQRPEQKLCLDLYRLWVHGEKPGDEAWRARAYESAMNDPWDGSTNWTNLALGVQSSQGVPHLPLWQRHRFDCETLGHNLGEWCAVNYIDRIVLGRACAVAGVQDPDHPAADLLRRDLLLFAIMARPIVCRDNKGRVLYEGYGWRQAGLRSTANHWDGWTDSYLMARILGLDARPSAKGARQEREFIELVATVKVRVQDGIETDDGEDNFHLLMFGAGVRSFDSPEYLKALATPLRTPPGMSAILARDTVSGDTFSCLLGTRIGYNTGATFGVHAKGPELADCTHLYAWRDRSGAPIDRVRTGKLKKAGPVRAWIDDDPQGGPENRLIVEAERGGVDVLLVPSWVWDDSRAIRLEVWHDRPAVLSLPTGAKPGVA